MDIGVWPSNYGFHCRRSDKDLFVCLFCIVFEYTQIRIIKVPLDPESSSVLASTVTAE